MKTDLSGTWENSFGSQMSFIVDGTRITGTYTSHTGSVGEYLLVGNCSAESPSKELGQSLVIAIYWKNIRDGIRDESWHWAGSMCGQLQLDGKMTLTNSIVVSVPFESYQKGNYIDELVFVKKESDLQDDSLSIVKKAIELEPYTNAYPLTGKWISIDDAMTLNINHTDPKTGLTSAALINSDKQVQLLGFIDVDVTAGMAQSVAFTGYSANAKEMSSISGMLNDGCEYLTLYSWMARTTSPQDSFMQTKMASITFKKSTS